MPKGEVDPSERTSRLVFRDELIVRYARQRARKKKVRKNSKKSTLAWALIIIAGFGSPLLYVGWKYLPSSLVGSIGNIV